ncbi:MAG TPA: 3-phosphoshikimate 1-carboxyvinyltransferase [Vicinamibacterales bacterium]|jgi:3-phosphoshikimate 1-carboxyvinyltransferase
MPSSTAVTIAPARRIQGRLQVPGDKSISHRYALLAALAEGTSELTNFSPGADCRSTLFCLQRLGVDITDGAAGSVTVMGRGVGRLCSPSGPLDAGNSGTTMRLMAGVVAGHPFSSRFVGDASLSGRPMRRVIQPLEQMGARIEATDGHAPFVVHGAQLQAIAHHPDVPSAQVKSAVLLAGLHADGTTSVLEPAATRNHTERALEAFGGTVSVNGLTVSVAGRQRFVARRLSVPGDFSSAAFWLVAAAAIPGSRIEIEHVGLNPTRTALLDVLRRFGARVDVAIDAGAATTNDGEPHGTILVEHDRVHPIEIRPDEIPGLIDELPAIAALAAHGGHVTVSGAAELRVKESDRIAALVAGFRALGLDADERPDGFMVAGGTVASGRRPKGGVADARGDHRMAMAFAIAALAADKPSTIDGADAVVISYPGFFDTLSRLTT